MPGTKFWIVDTFCSEKKFSGNPAAVMMVTDLEDKSRLQNIALEINTPETAFFKKLSNGDFEIDTFTPLDRGLYFGSSLFAAAKVIKKNDFSESNNFNLIYADRMFNAEVSEDDGIRLRFGPTPVKTVVAPDGLNQALNAELVVSVAEARNALIVEVRSPRRLMVLEPNIDLLKAFSQDFVILTTDTHYDDDLPYDICCRVFAPKLGVVEDFATPLSHLRLAEYWNGRINKDELVCFQPSRKESFSYLKCTDNFIYIRGDCRPIIEGTMFV